MTQVLIIVDVLSAETTQMVFALKNAISLDCGAERASINVETVLAADLGADRQTSDRILCPLTLDLPETLPFPAQALFATCRDVAGLRRQLAAWQYITGDGAFWLPIALTAKGALYGEVIGSEVIGSEQGTELETTASGSRSGSLYTQPIHLSDRQRQPLYALGQRLLRSLNAPPAVYLLQFGWHDGAVCFDRLLPFPAAPAIASLNVQTPDLFACHWACLTNQPILDLVIGL